MAGNQVYSSINVVCGFFVSYFHTKLVTPTKCNLSITCAVPPAYYAHLAAYRARFYMEPNVTEIAKPRGARSKDGSVRPLPALKEKVKNVMFYC